jgi:hypothetical protein
MKENNLLQNLDITFALKIVIQHYRSSFPERKNQPLHVFLGFDEFIRLEDPKVIAEILNEIGLNMDEKVDGECALFSCLITSLDAIMVDNNSTRSGRPVEFIPLPPLEHPQPLFHEFTPDRIDPQVLEALIADCSGHPKTLDMLYSLLKKDLEENMDLDKRHYAYLFQKLCRQPTRLSVGSSVDYVRFAMENRIIPLNTVLHNVPEADTSTTLLDAIASGVYQGTTVENGGPGNGCAPQMTCVQLVQYAAKSTTLPLFKECLDMMFKAERPDFSGRYFEIWHLGTVL